MGSGSLNIFAVEPPDPEDDAVAELAVRYMRVMEARVRMHVSRAATARWCHAFRMIRKGFTLQEMRAVVDAVEFVFCQTNYTNPVRLREQFGPLLHRVKNMAPHTLVEGLPLLPESARWVTWAAAFAAAWPTPVSEDQVVTALRYQLHIFNTCAGRNIGWPVAARWLEAKAREWHGWKRCPPISSASVYWVPGCPSDALLDSIVDANIRRDLRNGNYPG